MNNPNYYKSHWPDIISGYSDNIAEYRGRGKIALKNKDELDCEFKIIQTREGTILSLCNLIIRDMKLFPISNNFDISALSGETDAIRLHVEDRLETGEENPQPESVSLTLLEVTI